MEKEMPQVILRHSLST